MVRCWPAGPASDSGTTQGIGKVSFREIGQRLEMRRPAFAELGVGFFFSFPPPLLGGLQGGEVKHRDWS